MPKIFPIRVLQRTQLSSISNNFDLQLSSVVRISNTTVHTFLIRSCLPDVRQSIVIKAGESKWIPLHWLFPQEFFLHNTNEVTDKMYDARELDIDAEDAAH